MASSSAECSWDKLPFNFVRGQELVSCWVSKRQLSTKYHTPTGTYAGCSCHFLHESKIIFLVSFVTSISSCSWSCKGNTSTHRAARLVPYGAKCKCGLSLTATSEGIKIEAWTKYRWTAHSDLSRDLCRLWLRLLSRLLLRFFALEHRTTINGASLLYSKTQIHRRLGNTHSLAGIITLNRGQLTAPLNPYGWLALLWYLKRCQKTCFCHKPSIAKPNFTRCNWVF